MIEILNYRFNIIVFITDNIRTKYLTMKEMILLAKALMKCKSYKERQERLSEAFDQLSFKYPDLYSQLFRELKKRDIESNNINNISKWLNSSSSYVKLHEALILVKSNNWIVKEEYLNILKRMMYETIENGTNMYETVKLCHLVEKCAHLRSIREHLKYLMQRVYQLYYNGHYSHMELQPNNSGQNNFQPIYFESFKHLNILHDQLRNTQMLQPSNSKTPYSVPFLNLNCYGYDHLEIVATTNQRPTYDIPQSQTIFNLTIIEQNMDREFRKWLYYLKLHKYIWFFSALSYLEIECINEENIEGFMVKVNKNTITKGAQKKICLSTKTLRDRKQKLKDLLISLDLEVTLKELCDLITYMRDILNYPIPNKNCVVGNQLQQDIVCVMEKLLNQLLEKLSVSTTFISESLLGTSINTFLECTLLITGNQVFTKQQVDQILIFAKMLKFKVHQIPRNSH